MISNTQNYISQEEIHSWLSKITTSENLFMSYYETTGQNTSLENMYNIVTNPIQHSIGLEANTDLRSINHNYTQLKETMLFSETNWFHPFSDVAIHKHLRYFPDFWHNHSFFEMCYVISGECSQYLLTDSNTIHLNLHTGDILIIPPSVEHSLTMNSDSIVINILIRQSTFESALLNNLPSDTILYIFFLNTLYSKDKERYILCHSGEGGALIKLFYYIAETYCNNLLYANNIVNQLLSTFFSIILRDYSSFIEFVGENTPCLELIPSIMQYMEINYVHTNIQDIADHFGFNASYLGQMFKKSTGSTLVDALIQVRISKAKKLLTSSSLSVELISERVGYTDTTYFIRIFKRLTGFTPLQYRKKTIEI